MSVSATARITAVADGRGGTALPVLESDGPLAVRRTRSPDPAYARATVVGAMSAPLGGDRLAIEVRAEDWDRFAWPSGFGGLFHRQGLAIAAVLVVSLVLLFMAVQTPTPETGAGFYAYLAHNTMVGIFALAFGLPPC